jgi:hypothetical protein
MCEKASAAKKKHPLHHSPISLIINLTGCHIYKVFLSLIREEVAAK